MPNAEWLSTPTRGARNKGQRSVTCVGSKSAGPGTVQASARWAVNSLWEIMPRFIKSIRKRWILRARENESYFYGSILSRPLNAPNIEITFRYTASVTTLKGFDAMRPYEYILTNVCDNVNRRRVPSSFGIFNYFFLFKHSPHPPDNFAVYGWRLAWAQKIRTSVNTYSTPPRKRRVRRIVRVLRT